MYKRFKNIKNGVIWLGRWSSRITEIPEEKSEWVSELWSYTSFSNSKRSIKESQASVVPAPKISKAKIPRPVSLIRPVD